MPNKLSDTKSYIEPFCRYQSSTVGTNNMPLIGIANIVRNIILSAPFTWSFNRNFNDSITTVIGQQDYPSTILDFGFLEQTTVEVSNDRMYELKDMMNNDSLAKSNTKARPLSISVQGYQATPVVPTLAGAIKTSFSSSNTSQNQLSFTVPQTVIAGDTLAFALETSSGAGIPASITDSLGNTITQISTQTAAATVVPDAVATQLGVAAAYALLAYSGITNTGATVITGGNIGSSNVAATLSGMTLTPPAVIDNAGATAARTAGNLAFTYYSGLTQTMALTTADIGSSGTQHSPGAANGTYYAGVYVSGSSIAITTPVTLDAQGNSNALFVFYSTASTVTQAIAGTINLVNGAGAENVIWVVGSSWITIGPGAVTVGNILAYTSITLGGGTLAGRALAVGAGNGAVTIATAVTQTVTSTASSSPDDHQFTVYNMPITNSGTSTITITAQPVTASLTLTQVIVSGTTVTYYGTVTGGQSNAFVGRTFVISGFAGSVNNVSLLITGSTATTLVGVTTAQVNEVHAATASSTLTSRNFLVQGVLLTGVGPIQLTSPVNASGTGTTWSSQSLTTTSGNEVLLSFTAAYAPPASITDTFSLLQSGTTLDASSVSVQLSTAALLGVAAGPFTSSWSQSPSGVWQIVLVGYPSLPGLGNTSPTFRFSAVPDLVYPVDIIYQKKPVQFVTLTDSWAPIPDSFSDVYNNLALGYYMDSCQDSRAPQYIARGIAGLLARAQGLTATDKAVFAASYLNFSAQQMLEMLKTQQGQQAQGSR